MGIYLNPDNIDFQRALNSEIYVDKSELIKYTNKSMLTEQQFICVSRPRRFGKSMAANMLTAYYSKGCDSREIFSPLKISKVDTFEKHLNKYNVIRVNMMNFLSEASNIDDTLEEIQKSILFELTAEFSDVRFYDNKKLIRSLNDVFAQYRIPFIFIIDEWDCLFRMNQNDKEAQTKYLDFLRSLLKDRSYVALAYMTGILPIKKYGRHSALNMFMEFSMTSAEPVSEFTGFTEKEVEALCVKYRVSDSEMKRWYDGYLLDGYSIYNPKSVVEMIMRKKFNNYWTSTETYEALKIYIEMNYDGLRDTITELLSGSTCRIDTTTFTNDMITFHTKDDVLTLLIHLGYLTYNFDTKEISIPNHEIAEQFASTIKVIGWSEVTEALKISEKLLDATLTSDEKTVAELIDKAHDSNTSVLKYNDENSLACIISLAYYSARKSYFLHRELPAGKGFADIVFEPRSNCNTPALVIELKYNQSADAAITQIKQKNYFDCLKSYSGEVLLVGINYDKKSKKHSCRMERIIK